jgi:hypothetical protein
LSLLRDGGARNALGGHGREKERRNGSDRDRDADRTENAEGRDRDRQERGWGVNPFGRTTKRLFSSLKTSAARRVEVSTLMCFTSSWRRLLQRDRLGRGTPADINLADVLTKALPAATFDRLVKKCRDSTRGEYYVKLADEQVQYVSDEKTWMVTDMW